MGVEAEQLATENGFLRVTGVIAMKCLWRIKIKALINLSHWVMAIDRETEWSAIPVEYCCCSSVVEKWDKVEAV